MSSQLELETFAGATIQAYKDQAKKAGIVLAAANSDQHNGDFPPNPYFLLRRFKRNIAITKNHKKVVTHMIRQLVSTRDEFGKPVKREFLTYTGYWTGKTHRGQEYHANFEIGKYEKPRIVPNDNLTYNQRTGEPIGPEYILSGSDIIYTIEVPKSKAEERN